MDAALSFEAHDAMSDSAAEGPLQAYRRMRRDGALKHDPAQELAVEKLQALHKRLAQYDPTGETGWTQIFALKRRRREPPPQGLYMFGDVGRGKSMLMDLLFATVPMEHKRRVHFHAFMQEVHDAVHAWRQAKDENGNNDGDDPIPPFAETVAAQAWLLCFDEFQVTNVADAMILGRLFTELFERGVVVVATSNVAPDDLYAGGLNRELFLPFIALFKQKLDILHLPGDTDHRRARQIALLDGMPTYHYPLGPKARQSLDTAFKGLTEDAVVGEDTITVKGRNVTSAAAGGGIARFTFAELCHEALGPADYLAIAARYHTVVLADVPKLKPKEHNEAKRFVTLIDALYEHKVKLIVAADAAPDKLYPEGETAFEFARTASRLMEMQSHDYLTAPHDPPKDVFG